MTESIEQTTPQGDVSTAPSESVATPDVSTAPEPSAFSIPDEYKDRGYTQGIESIDQLWKKLDGSQKLIGDRGAFIPGEDANEEQLGEFKSRLQERGLLPQGAPESYEWGNLELPEGVSISDAHTEKFGELAKKLNLNQDTANDLRKEWVGIELQMAAERNEKLETEFNEIVKNEYGDQWESKVANAAALFKPHMDQETAEKFADIPNQYLFAMVKAANAFGDAKQPDAAPSMNGGTTVTLSEAQQQLKDTMKKARENPMNKGLMEDFHKAQEQLRNIQQRG